MKYYIEKLDTNYCRGFYERCLSLDNKDPANLFVSENALLNLFFHSLKQYILNYNWKEIAQNSVSNMEFVDYFYDKTQLKQLIVSNLKTSEFIPDEDEDGEPFDPSEVKGFNDCTKYFACEQFEKTLNNVSKKRFTELVEQYMKWIPGDPEPNLN